MNEITVSRALVRLKTLDSQIRSEIEDMMNLVLAKPGKRAITGYASEEEFAKEAIRTYDKLNGLIAERKKVKAAVVASNAQTTVTVAGKRYTVAEAIERKNSLEYDKLLLARLKEQYRTAVVNVERANNDLETNKVDRYIESVYGKDAGTRDRSGEIQKARQDYLDQNSWVMLDPLNLAQKIEALEEDIHTFEAEVDVVLSESNATTRIVLE